VSRLSRPAIRRLIEQLVRSDADLDAFFLDYFPHLHKRVSGSMDRVAKLNVLFEQESDDTISEKLRLAFPGAVAAAQEPRDAKRGAEGSQHAGASTTGEDVPPVHRSFLGSLWGTLATPRGLAQTLGLLVGVSILCGSVIFSRGRPSLGSTVVSGLLVLVCGTALLRGAWRRWRIPSVSTTRFVGPQPMDEKDAPRFHGRDAKLEEIIRTLTRPEIRHILLFGESGCGKTSLLRAGLLPRLQDRYECIYLRFTDNPIGALHEALRSAKGAAVSEPRQHLVDELRQAQQRAGRTLLICIDQFEEFHNNPIGGADFQEVLDFIWAISGERAGIDARLILCLRHDFLHLLTVFYSDRGFAKHEAKITVDPFEAEAAEEVIQRLLQRERGGLLWDADLVHRVLNDLVFQRLQFGQLRRYVLPTELQIVFQMVQSRRIRRSEDYPGKKRLLLDYVSEAIATVPAADPPLVKQLLLCFMDSNGLTKAKPQTLPQLARQIQTRDLVHLRQTLHHLDRNRHMIRSFHAQPDGAETESSGELQYELAHDYLAGVIRIVAGAEMSGAKRSQALLETARLHLEQDRDYRIPIGDCLQLWRYPAERMTAEDRGLWHRSLRSFGLRYCLPVLCVLSAALFVRFGTHTIVMGLTHEDRYEAVLVRGLPFLPPISGAYEPSVATGFIVKGSELLESGELKPLLADLQRGVWRPSGLAFLHSNWDPDRYLRKRIATSLRPLVFPERADCLYEETIDTDLFKLYLISVEDLGELTEWYHRAVLCSLSTYLTKCNGEEKDDTPCSRYVSSMQTMADLFTRIPDQTHERQEVTKQVGQIILQSSTNLEVTVKTVDVYLTVEERADQSVRIPLRQKVHEQLVHAMATTLQPGAVSLDKLMGILSLFELVRQLRDANIKGTTDTSLQGQLPSMLQFRDLLLEAVTDSLALAARARILNTLQDLMPTDEKLLTFLKTQLASPDINLRVDAFYRLAALAPGDPAVINFFRATLANAVSQLQRYQPTTTSRVPAELRASLRLCEMMFSQSRRWRYGHSRIGKPYDPLERIITQEALEADRRSYLDLFILISRYVRVTKQLGDEGIDEYRFSFFRTGLDRFVENWIYWKDMDPRTLFRYIAKVADEVQGKERPLFMAFFNHALVREDDEFSDVLIKVTSENEEIRRQIESLIIQGRTTYVVDEDCKWSSLALRYKLQNPLIHQKVAQLLNKCDDDLSKPYARFKLLGPPTATLGTGADAALERIIAWRSSPEAERSTAYRQVATEGLQILRSRQREHPGGKQWFEKVHERFRREFRDPWTPLRYRRAYLEIF
jgi:hypothetical protein